jgi:hypothetical protein
MWIFSIFDPVRFVSVQPALSPPFLFPGVISSDRYCHASAPCHVFFWWSQDEFVASASSSSNASSYHLPSRAEIEELNLHHRHRPPSTLPGQPDSHNLSHSSHYSTASPFYLLPSQSIIPSERQPPPSFPFTAILRPLSLRTMTPTTTN